MVVARRLTIWMFVFHRYISNAIVYMGASDEQEEGTLVGVHAVLSVVQGLGNREHVIVVDNFFTSVLLAMALLDDWNCKERFEGLPPLLGRPE
jgi:hypothetical protein